MDKLTFTSLRSTSPFHLLSDFRVTRITVRIRLRYSPGILKTSCSSLVLLFFQILLHYESCHIALELLVDSKTNKTRRSKRRSLWPVILSRRPLIHFYMTYTLVVKYLFNKTYFFFVTSINHQAQMIITPTILSVSDPLNTFHSCHNQIMGN